MNYAEICYLYMATIWKNECIFILCYYFCSGALFLKYLTRIMMDNIRKLVHSVLIEWTLGC